MHPTCAASPAFLLQNPTSFSPMLPSAFDWKKNLSPAKTQGLCASCWAFASTTVMEAYISIQFKKTPVSLSPQSMVDCNVDFSCVTFALSWKALHGMTQGGTANAHTMLGLQGVRRRRSPTLLIAVGCKLRRAHREGLSVSPPSHRRNLRP